MNRRSLLLVLTAALVACSDGDGRESFGDKKEWSILQGVEFANRKTQIQTTQDISVQGYELLGIRNSAGTGNVWIMLWPKSAPFYKQIPGGTFVLQKDFLDELIRSHRVSSTVAEALRGHVGG